ncbi:TlpA disulfide reductase family protein [Aquimarina sp. 2201CG5-10]|uniref:TlpA family protein disulfide reductase n=1 Tax=Aquimarina callyspongiae TaxID=3098150 RepID=UPI002AB48107|nr:TlpA disulfide reductase family protein [Aquimarina sp. 2201CG5-10]MDY8137323.1 TlpA disulfide reductase family protein [Aquimarina sp. 2201CG5-10]
MRKIIILLVFLGTHHNFYSQENKIPDVQVTTSNGEKIQILDKIDKLTIIDYWATWCKPCIAEMLFLEKIEKKYAGKLDIISISVDNSEGPWKKYITKKNKTGHQYWIDSQNSLMELITEEVTLRDGQKGISWSIPRFLLVDKDGKILNSDCPPPSTGSLDTLIEKNL